MKKAAETKVFDHSGSSFDSFLEEERIREEVGAVAIKRVLAWQLAQEMKQQRKTKQAMARDLQTSTSSTASTACWLASVAARCAGSMRRFIRLSPTILNHRCTTCGTLREWRSGRESESLLSFFEPKQEENLFGSGSSGFLGRKIGGVLVMTSRPSNSAGRSACRRAGLCRTEFTRFERNLHKIELRGSFSISTGWAGWCCCTVS